VQVLVTNDDGITAPGLAALAARLRREWSVTVLAPDRNWSASGHVKTLHKPLRIAPARLADGEQGFACSGAPSDCVGLALLGALEDDGPFDIVVSGINPVANLAHDITYSGTVTAAMEAAVLGLPGIAVSRQHAAGRPVDVDYGPAAELAAAMVRHVAERGLPPNTLLNVNVPNLPADAIRGVLATRQGLRDYRDELVRRVDPRGRPYFWFGGDEPGGVEDEGTDIAAIASGFASVTPLRLDLTAGDMLDDLAAALASGTGDSPVRAPSSDGAQRRP